MVWYDDDRNEAAIVEVAEKLAYIREMLADRTRRRKVFEEIKKKWLV